jgi:aminoglycoside phosphotransferase (APT) family kinase protein
MRGVGEIAVSALELIGAGREAEVFALGERRVLRLARSPASREEVERERIALTAIARCGAPAPALFDRVDVEGRPGLVLERLDAHDLLHGLLRRPWEVVLLPAVLAKVHASLHETVAPTELPDLRAEVAARLRSELVPSELRDAALRALEALSDGDRLCHGDFHPGNLLRRRDRGYAVIDWKAAARGVPAADIARTRLLMTGAWIPGAGPRRWQLLLTPFRVALYAAYLRAYARRRSVERRAITAWVPVLAAARLSEDIDEERAWLLALARRGLRGHMHRG